MEEQKEIKDVTPDIPEEVLEDIDAHPQKPKQKGAIVKALIAGVAGGVIALGGIAGYNILNGNVGNFGIGTSHTSTKVSDVSYNIQTDTTKAVSAVSDAVVSVFNYQGSSNDASSLRGEGSGVIYKKDGNTAYIVTNNHVISGSQSVEVLLAGGQKIPAQVVGSDTFSDLAVLKIDSKDVKATAQFGDSSKLTVGEPAIAVGSPLGSEYANTATEGIVSSLARPVTFQNDQGQTVSANAIQTDAAINPGNSGGALINIKGQVIGITSSKITEIPDGNQTVSVEGMGFAIPANDVVSIINKLEGGKEIVRPALGIQMLSLSDMQREAVSQLKLPDSVTTGVVVQTVQDGLPAAQAGIKSNDVITAINDTPVSSGTDLQTALYKYNVGDTIQLTLYREGQKQTVSVKLDQSTDKINFNQ